MAVEGQNTGRGGGGGRGIEGGERVAYQGRQ